MRLLDSYRERLRGAKGSTVCSMLGRIHTIGECVRLDYFLSLIAYLVFYPYISLYMIYPL